MNIKLAMSSFHPPLYISSLFCHSNHYIKIAISIKTFVLTCLFSFVTTFCLEMCATFVVFFLKQSGCYECPCTTCFDKAELQRGVSFWFWKVVLSYFKIFFWWYCQYSSGSVRQCCRSLQLYIMLNFVFRHNVSWIHPSSKTGSGKFETFFDAIGN